MEWTVFLDDAQSFQVLEALCQRSRIATPHSPRELVKPPGSLEEGADDVERPLLLEHVDEGVHWTSGRFSPVLHS